MEPTPDEITSACQQACRYRQRIAIEAGACSAHNADEVVAWTEGVPTRHPDGRWQVGWVSDSTIGGMLSVWWYPASGVVGIDDVDALPELPQYEAPPIARRGADYGWETSPGFVYFHDGHAYDAPEAEAAINRLGNLEGWTWQRVKKES